VDKVIIYLLLKGVLFVLGVVSTLFGSLIPSFPDSISSVLQTISTMIQGGISFLSYFFYVPVVVALISLVISWHGFSVVKDAVMKVIGHFLGN
jgi:divalent metal cation (Fe/Co/Zn/Cd) transporter